VFSNLISHEKKVVDNFGKKILPRRLSQLDPAVGKRKRQDETISLHLQHVQKKNWQIDL